MSTSVFDDFTANNSSDDSDKENDVSPKGYRPAPKSVCLIEEKTHQQTIQNRSCTDYATEGVAAKTCYVVGPHHPDLDK